LWWKKWAVFHPREGFLRAHSPCNVTEKSALLKRDMQDNGKVEKNIALRRLSRDISLILALNQ